jgi:hypothetical protein
VDIWFSAHDSFLEYAHSQKIGKPNNSVGRKKTNVPKGDSQKSVKVTCVWERRTLVLVISKLFKTCKFYLINHVITEFGRNIENAVFYICVFFIVAHFLDVLYFFRLQFNFLTIQHPRKDDCWRNVPHLGRYIVQLSLTWDDCNICFLWLCRIIIILFNVYNEKKV